MRISWTRAGLAGCALLACRPGPPDRPDAPDWVAPEAPIVVYWTIDTLGQTASDDVGMCAFIQDRAAAYGVEVACPEGAVAPSSWTGESHLRVLWPNHLAEGARGTQLPICETSSSLEQIARAHDGAWVFASDNSFSYKEGQPLCADGGWGWVQRADDVFLPFEDTQQVRAPEEAQPVHAGIGRVLERAAAGESLSVYLNDFHAGGHWPRCWFAPDTEACAALYQVGLDRGLTDGADPVSDWLDRRFRNALLTVATEVYAGDPHALRELVWQTMIEAILRFRAVMFEPRLERLLSGLEELGRLDDLVLVIAGDHGENPCVPSPLTGEVNCDHARIPTEYTANVPVFVAPAALAERWAEAGIVGDAERVWSLANVSWGLLDALDQPIPADWPEMEPVGVATSWSCLFTFVSAVRVAEGASVRCEDDACVRSAWAVPAGPAHEAEPIEALPAALVGFDEPQEGYPNWARRACAEGGE